MPFIRRDVVSRIVFIAGDVAVGVDRLNRASRRIINRAVAGDNTADAIQVALTADDADLHIGQPFATVKGKRSRLGEAVKKINQRPRKCLGYATAEEVFYGC